MKVVTGKIERLAPTADGGYNGSHGYVWTFDMTVRSADGTVSGEVGSKTQNYPLNIGAEITVEAKQTEHGPRLKKINPQYSGGGQGRGSGGEQKKDVDWDKIAEGKVLCNLISAAIASDQIKCPDIRTAKYLTDVVMGKPQGGDPNPDYNENPAPIDEADEIPF